MKKNKLFESLNDIDDKIIEEAGEFNGFKKKKRFNPMEFIIPLVAVAAIMIVVIPTFLNRDTPPGVEDIGERQDVIQEIKIFKAEKFDKASSDLLSVLNDEGSLKVFNNVISTAEKQGGIVDVTSPDYVFDIYYANDSKERLYLWLEEGMLGSFMKAEDTHTIYNFSEKMNNKLRDLIQKNLEISSQEKDYSNLIQEPDYKNAQFRADLGDLFYETDERIGLSFSFGTFIYNTKTEKLEAAFRIDHKKAFGEEYFPEYMMLKDEKTIEITAFSHQDFFREYHYEYNLLDKILYKVEGSTDKKDIYLLPDEERRSEAFYGSDWSLEGFTYNPPGAGKPLYPFKDLDLTDINIKIFKDLDADEIDSMIIVSNYAGTTKTLISDENSDVVNYLKEITANEPPYDTGDNDRSNVIGFITIYFKDSSAKNIYFKEDTLEIDDKWYYGGINDIESFNDFYKSIKAEEQPWER